MMPTEDKRLFGANMRPIGEQPKDWGKCDCGRLTRWWYYSADYNRWKPRCYDCGIKMKGGDKHESDPSVQQKGDSDPLSQS